jgi:vancomycin resistance protein VanJ
LSRKKPALVARFFYLINNLVALATWAAYLAWFINPSSVPLAGMLALAVPVFIVANVIFLVIWLIFFRRFAWLSLITLALGWWHLSGLVGWNLKAAGETTANTFRVMTYNVRSFHYPGPYKWHNTPPGIARLTDSLQPDILCMQEYLHSEDWLPDFKHPHKFIANSNELSLAIYSTFPIIHAEEVAYTKRAGEYRGFVYADILNGNDTLRVVNIHLMSIGINAKDLSKIKQLQKTDEVELEKSSKRLFGQLMDAYRVRGKQVVQVRQFLVDSPYPIILCGDFNDTPTTYTYRVLGKGKTNAFTTAGSGFGTSQVKFHSNHLPLRIDHIIVDKRFTPVHAEVVQKVFSDHYPVFADIALNTD